MEDTNNHLCMSVDNYLRELMHSNQANVPVCSLQRACCGKRLTGNY